MIVLLEKTTFQLLQELRRLEERMGGILDALELKHKDYSHAVRRCRGLKEIGERITSLAKELESRWLESETSTLPYSRDGRVE